jgi:hypothetical protein
MFALQKFRSVGMEELISAGHRREVVESLLADLEPWIFGNKCPLPVPARVLDAVDGGKQVDPLFFYNMVFIARVLEPSLGFACGIFGLEEEPLPELPEAHWLKGWEPE